MAITRYEHIKWQEVDELSETQRGAGNYGSTGVS
jgi:dUTP pyrophosphatase